MSNKPPSDILEKLWCIFIILTFSMGGILMMTMGALGVWSIILIARSL